MVLRGLMQGSKARSLLSEGGPREEEANKVRLLTRWLEEVGEVCGGFKGHWY